MYISPVFSCWPWVTYIDVVNLFYVYIVSVKVEIGTTYKGHVNTNESRYFEIPITREGIIIDIQAEMGELVMYGSHKNPNPNEIHYDNTKEIKNGKINKPAKIPYRFSNAGIYYCNLFGKKECQFSVKVDIGHDRND